MYKNNQTTSTKCQYQAARSIIKKWLKFLFIAFILISVKIKYKDPIITCKPWNPVAIKKIFPYEESEILNSAWEYSIYCSIEK